MMSVSAVSVTSQQSKREEKKKDKDQKKMSKEEPGIYPPFSENEDNVEAFIMDKKAKELLLEELVCFHTKMPLKANTLGIGISIKKSPKTGKFSFVNPIMDLLNMRAYTKLKIRNSLTAEKFTHWLPLYFGENETYTIESESYNHEERKFETEKKVINT